jgi:hypothetical protein
MIRTGLRVGLPLAAAVLLMLPPLHAQDGRGRKYKPPPPTCKISVTVVKSKDGKPVEDAAVVFHPIDKNGKDEGNMELKTNEDGKAVISVIPIGANVRVQVIAEGYQTYGDNFDITDDTKDITIKLKRPVRQYSIYENHPDQNGSSQSNNSGQSGNQSSSNQQQGSQDSQKPPQ